MIIREKDLYLHDSDELYHYGVLGMKWGRRKDRGSNSARAVRGHAGIGRYIGKKRQLEGDKRDLKKLNEGQHLSIGFTKKRQAAYDARDKQALEKRIAKNEKALSNKSQKKVRNESDDYKESREIKKKHISEMSNAELNKLNKRMELERKYSQLNPSAVEKGLKYAGALVGITGTILTLEQNSDRLIKLGKQYSDRLIKLGKRVFQ